MRALREQWLGVTIASIALFVAAGGPTAAIAAIDDLITGKEIANRTITDRDIAKKTLGNLRGQTGPAGETGATGPQGPRGDTGPAGSADTPAQVRDKLATVDGAGSGVDSDLLDGTSSAAFVADGDSAAGDVTGPFSNLQIGTNAVGTNEIASNGVGTSEIATGAVDSDELNDNLGDTITEDDLAFGAVTQEELESGGSGGTAPTIGFDLAADTCETRTVGFNDGFDLGELVIPRPESSADSSDLYLLPAVVTRDGFAPVVFCNASNSAIDDAVRPALDLTLVAP